MKRIIFFTLAFTLILAHGCKDTTPAKKEFLPTDQQKAEDAIKNWMLTNNDYPHYKPIVFGELTARFERSDRSLQISTLIYEQEAISEKTGDTHKLDSLRSLLNSNRGRPLGFIILHKYQTTNLAGEVNTDECLVFLDTTLRVASVLSPESFDLIMTEEVFYRLDPEK